MLTARRRIVRSALYSWSQITEPEPEPEPQPQPQPSCSWSRVSLSLSLSKNVILNIENSKILKLKIKRDRQTDGQTNKRTERQCRKTMSHNFFFLEFLVLRIFFIPNFSFYRISLSEFVLFLTLILALDPNPILNPNPNLSPNLSPNPNLDQP
jgi:hypothetical protein